MGNEIEATPIYPGKLYPQQNKSSYTAGKKAGMMRLICKIKENNRRGISNHDSTPSLSTEVPMMQDGAGETKKTDKGGPAQVILGAQTQFGSVQAQFDPIRRWPRWPRPPGACTSSQLAWWAVTARNGVG